MTESLYCIAWNSVCTNFMFYGDDPHIFRYCDMAERLHNMMWIVHTSHVFLGLRLCSSVYTVQCFRLSVLCLTRSPCTCGALAKLSCLLRSALGFGMGAGERDVRLALCVSFTTIEKCSQFSWHAKDSKMQAVLMTWVKHKFRQFSLQKRKKI